MTLYLAKERFVIIDKPPYLISPLDESGETWRVYWPKLGNVRLISDPSEDYDIPIREYRLLPEVLRRTELLEAVPTSKRMLKALPGRKKTKYDRVVITEPLDPIIISNKVDQDDAMEKWLDENNLPYEGLKKLLTGFANEMRNLGTIPNYLALVDWANWGVKYSDRHNVDRGIRYMYPKIWTEEELAAFVPEITRIRRTLPPFKKRLLDSILSKSVLAEVQ